MIAEDVAMIKVSGQNQKDEEDGEAHGMIGSTFGKLKDTQVINATEYKI